MPWPRIIIGKISGDARDGHRARQSHAFAGPTAKTPSLPPPMPGWLQLAQRHARQKTPANGVSPGRHTRDGFCAQKTWFEGTSAPNRDAELIRDQRMQQLDSDPASDAHRPMLCFDDQAGLQSWETVP